MEPAEGDPPEAGDAPPEGKPPDPPKSPAPRAARGRRKLRLRDVAEDALHSVDSLFVADPSTARVRARFTGQGLEPGRADLDTAADSMKRLSRLFAVITASRPRLYALDVGHSIEVEIGPPDDEIKRAVAALRAVEAEHDEKAARRMMQQVLPETTLAAYAVRDLILASEEDVVGAALSYGTQVTDAYKSLVRQLADESVSLELALPTDEDPSALNWTETVSLDTATAQGYKHALAAVGSDETVTVAAVGTLTMADSANKQVRLAVERSGARDPALRNRRVITARYTQQAGQEIRDLNLWDSQVRARFEMTRDRRGTTAHVRRPTFLLVEARPRFA